MHVRASRPRPARKKHGRRSVDGGQRTGRAGSPSHQGRQRCNSSRQPPTASAAARPPEHLGRASTLSPSREAVGAQPPTPEVKRLHGLFPTLPFSFLFSFHLVCFFSF